MSSWFYMGTVVVYVLLMLAIGYWCMRRTKSVGDFFLGGRSLGPWMSAFAYGTTYFSAVLFIGYAFYQAQFFQVIYQPCNTGFIAKGGVAQLLLAFAIFFPQVV